MKLRTKLLLATSLIVLIVLGISEWASYRQMSRFLNDHETRMGSDMSHGAVLADLRQGRQALFVKLSMLHVFHAAFTILALVVALNALWSRTVLRPLQDLLRHINYMGRGSWTTTVPVRSKDEIGELTQAFNDLGIQLTLSVQQFAAASKLSALALLGQGLVRRAVKAAELLRASESHLGAGRQGREAIPEPALANLRLAIKTLEEIPSHFDGEFQRQFSLYSASGSPDAGVLRDGDAARHGLARAVHLDAAKE